MIKMCFPSLYTTCVFSDYTSTKEIFYTATTDTLYEYNRIARHNYIYSSSSGRFAWVHAQPFDFLTEDLV
jgi:hypothetical protein